MSEPIYGFSGAHDFLSNFHPSPIRMPDGILYPAVEHAFQAQKDLDLNVRRRIAALRSSGAVKRAGKRGTGIVTLRADWDTGADDEAMMTALRLKFSIGMIACSDRRCSEKTHRALLLATEHRELIEANTWNDRKWGVDRRSGIGENRLGVFLMRIRSEALL